MLPTPADFAVPSDPTDSSDSLAYVASLPGVADAVERARAAVDGLRGHRVLRRSADRVAAESVLRGARASAALAGADVPLETVRTSDPDADDLDLVVRAALRVAAESVHQLTIWPRAPMQVLARLHAVGAAGQVEPSGLGRPAAGTAPRLAALAAVLSGRTTAPALVVAAVAHGDVASMQAFPVAGDLVARAVSRLTLVTRGLDPASVSVPEVGHVELGREAYLTALAGYAGGGADGVRGWVLHCAEAVVLGAREGVAICEAIQRGA